MANQVVVYGRQFATDREGFGVFELVGGAYQQRCGTGQTPKFRSPSHLRSYIYRNFGGR